MKKGSLNFLGRKTQNLFDTNVEFKEMGNVELMLDSAAIPESGTARVRSRPTVKHFTSTDALQGFAVPTPKVPLLPPLKDPTMNGTGSGRNLYNGGMASVPDMIEGEIFIPPPPSSAPPPPPPSSAAPHPPSFIPPPPVSYGERHPSTDRARLQPSLMPSFKPPSDYSEDLDLASLKPPPMAPPKPPSDTSSFKGSISSLDVQDIPDCPKFTPPPPPGVKPPPVLPKTQKMPPLKPIRMSSIPNLDIQSQTPTPPAASTPTRSSFNPQNTAKLYNVQKKPLLTEQEDRDKKVQSILFLEDSTGNPVGVHANGNSGKNPAPLPVQTVVPPVKPARRGSAATQLENDVLDGLQVKAPGPPAKPEVTISPEPVPASITPNTPSMAPTPMNFSPKTEGPPEVTQVRTHTELPGRLDRCSPVLKHRHLKTRGLESSGAKKETSTSPFALLMAAKERDKQRNNLSRQNSSSSETQTSVIQQNVEKPNSFTVTPRDAASERPSAEVRSTINTQPVVPLSTTAEVPGGPYSKPVLSSTPPPSFTSHRSFTPQLSPTPQRSFTPQLSPTPQLSSTPTNSSVGGRNIPVIDAESGEEIMFIPPPPEFANYDMEDEPPAPPPAHPAPAPPVKTAPLPAKPSLPAPITNGPLITPKPKPPICPPKAPGPPPNIQPKPPVQIKPAPPTVQPPPSVAASQSTLLSILQKKMLEMDPKFSAVKEAESNDDWNSPLSDDEGMSPPATPRALQTHSAAPPAQPKGLDMKELENKAARKAQDSSKSQNSNGSSSKQSFGMTFTVRPGSKQPITPVIKE